MSPPTDQRLLDDYGSSRSDAALAELMQRHGAMVLATCARITGDPHDAEDAAQVVFIILARKAGSLGRVDCLAAWLHRTARFVALRARAARVRRSRREAPLSSAAEPATMAVADPVELREQLDAALDRLPAIYREALLLHHVEGRSCEDIAATVDASAEAVAMRLSRGRELLRRRLRQPPTDVFSRTLAGIVAMPTVKLAPATVLAPTPAAQALLRQYLVAAKAFAVATSAAVISAAAALVVGAVVLTQRLTAAEPHAEPPPLPPIAAPAARAVGIPLCELWEARLQAALLRPVTVHASGADALAALRRIGERCEVPMVVDLAPAHAPLARVAIDAEGTPLGEVLDAIAHQTGLRSSFRAGVLWWEDAGSPQAGGPTALWVYQIDPAKLPPSGDPSDVVDQLRKAVGDWDREGVGIEQRSGTQLFVSQTPAMQQRIEMVLRDRLRPSQSADAPAMQAAAKLLPATFGDMPSGERQLRAALSTRLAIAPGATRLPEVVDAVARAAGVSIIAGGGVSLDRPLPRHTAEIHLQGMEARHVLALALLGSGLHAELRASPSGADGSVVIADGRPPMVKRRYDLTPLTRARTDANGVEESKPETQEFIDIMEKVVMPYSWSAEGVSVQEESGAAVVVQTVEAQDAIEELLSRMAGMELAGDASSRLPVPPALTIEVPSTRDF